METGRIRKNARYTFKEKSVLQQNTFQLTSFKMTARERISDVDGPESRAGPRACVRALMLV